MKLHIGQRVQVSECSGIDSGRFGTIISPVPWRQVPGMYGEPSNREACVRIEAGKHHESRIIYMFVNRLIVVK